MDKLTTPTRKAYPQIDNYKITQEALSSIWVITIGK